MPTPPNKKKSTSPVDVERRHINGLPIPPRQRVIDAQGYECTKHALHFRGDDWDIVLNNKREELTAAFIHDAAAATGEPVAHLHNIRYALDERHRMTVRFEVQHKAQTPKSVVQDRLATYRYKSVTALYEPRQKKLRINRCREEPTCMTASFPSIRRAKPPVSCYGRAVAAVGPNGPEFRDEKEKEEPTAVEHEEKIIVANFIP